ncbi:MAG: cellulase family glycosylhydrolase [Clostridiales bacterium]|nr:cellulase family glycosylhydrolase [Clostridiales bacterium]
MKTKYCIYTICLVLIAMLCLMLTLGACSLFEEPEKYMVRYARGADDASGEPPSVEFYKEGAKVTLKAATTYAREGYTFKAWSDGNATYEAGAVIKMPARDVMFTAQWEPNEDQSKPSNPPDDNPSTPPDDDKKPDDTSCNVTATEVKFENGNIVFKGTAGGGVTNLVAYLYDTNEKIESYKATANIGSDRTFTVRIKLAQLTASPGNWYYLMISVNGGAKNKVEYTKYNHNETYNYGGRRYKWEYYEGIAVNYVNLSYELDMSSVTVRAGHNGRVYLSVSGTYSGYSEQDFDIDIQLQSAPWTTYAKDVTVNLKDNLFTVKMDISDAVANSSGQFYSIHLIVDGVSVNVASGSDPWIVETTATDDNKIYKLRSDYVGWGDDAFIMKLVVVAQSGQLRQNDYLKVNGADVRKNYGQGDTVMLRGTNAGGLMVSEQWMTAINYKDYKTANEILINRFDEERARDLWAYYRSYFWTDADFKNCSDMGMTVLRLPFTYMNVDFNGNYDFSALDDFVRGAAKYGIYTVLDLHGAYGSQNGQDHSGQVIENDWQVDFYTNTEKKAKTVALWKALATHYKGNPAIAGFDLLNEPSIKGGLTGRTQWDFYNELYVAIRAIDKDRIIIFESCWAGSDMPHPSEYGWQNCMYSFHHYTNESNAQAHNRKFEERLVEVKNRNFGIPVYMGEFTAYGNEDAWVRTLELLKEYGWHWTNWTYKTNNNMGGWGIYYTWASSPNLSSDSIYDIKDKFRGTSTTYAHEATFGSGKTLSAIIKQALN